MIWISSSWFLGSSLTTGDPIPDTTAVIGQAVSFVLIFFVSLNFSRADHQYLVAMNLVTETTQWMHNFVQGEYGTNVSRYALAGLLLSFVNLSEVLPIKVVYEVDTTYQLLIDEEWKELEERDVLDALCAVAAKVRM